MCCPKTTHETPHVLFDVLIDVLFQNPMCCFDVLFCKTIHHKQYIRTAHVLFWLPMCCLVCCLDVLFSAIWIHKQHLRTTYSMPSDLVGGSARNEKNKWFLWHAVRYLCRKLVFFLFSDEFTLSVRCAESSFSQRFQRFPIKCKIVVVELLASRACFMVTSRRSQET